MYEICKHEVSMHSTVLFSALFCCNQFRPPSHRCLYWTLVNCWSLMQ